MAKWARSVLRKKLVGVEDQWMEGFFFFLGEWKLKIWKNFTLEQLSNHNFKDLKFEQLFSNFCLEKVKQTPTLKNYWHVKFKFHKQTPLVLNIWKWSIKT